MTCLFVRRLLILTLSVHIYVACGKPVTRQDGTRMVRRHQHQRRHNVDDIVSEEMQTFMVDLSAKDDMNRLKERFQKVDKRDTVENDEYFRRLRRFSVHGEHAPSRDVPMVTMTRSSRTVREDNDVTDTSFSENAQSKQRNNLSILHVLRKRNLERKTIKHLNNTFLRDNNARNELNKKTNVLIKKMTIDGSDDLEDSTHNHHFVGKTWELVHHSNPGSMTNDHSNTTMHQEYFHNDEDLKEYAEIEKSRRKPRVVRVRRSMEPEYEIHQVSAIHHNHDDDDDDDDVTAHVTTVNERPIKSDGYIGCFIDHHPVHDLTKSYLIDDLTPLACQTICKQKGHVYTGVQYGYQCHCGDNYGKYGHVKDQECNSVCGGDNTKNCGGFWRNAVYATDIDERDSTERKSRSDILKVAAIKKPEKPVHQDITVFLRSQLPDDPLLRKFSQSTERKPTMRKTFQRKPEIAKTTAALNKKAYLHPQNIARSFVPSKTVLKHFTPRSDKRSYRGSVKLKQSWHDDLKDANSIKTKILAGNLEYALKQMLKNDEDFDKADVLGFREGIIRGDPNTVHKVLVDFALTFENSIIDKSEKIRALVEDENRLNDMPVFGDSLDIKEYENPYVLKLSEHENNSKEIREAENGVDSFLENALSQL